MKTSLLLSINFRKLIAFPFLFLLMAFTSCSIEEDALTPSNHAITTERIDFNIDGDIIDAIHQETDDLVSYSVKPEPIVNIGEHLVTVNTGENSFLTVTVYQKYFNHPLEQQFQFGAFALNQLSEKAAYIVVDYFIDGQRAYCSAPDHLDNAPQYNVFRVVDKGNYYLIRIENVRLFDIINKRKVTDENYIEILGTFTLQK